MVDIGVEVLTLLRHPHTNPERLCLTMDRNLDDASDKVLSVIYYA